MLKVLICLQNYPVAIPAMRHWGGHDNVARPDGRQKAVLRTKRLIMLFISVNACATCLALQIRHVVHVAQLAHVFLHASRCKPEMGVWRDWQMKNSQGWLTFGEVFRRPMGANGPNPSRNSFSQALIPNTINIRQRIIQVGLAERIQSIFK